MSQRWRMVEAGHWTNGKATIHNIGSDWIRDGRAYRTLHDAKKRARVKPTKTIREGTQVVWDDVVRQLDPAHVLAVQQLQPFVVSTSWGENLHAKAGDWLLGSGEEQWPVGRREFATTYVKVKAGTYTKTGWALMKRMPQDFVVSSREGTVRGTAGDVLLQGPLGDRWRIAAARYETKGYLPIAELPAHAPPSPVPPPVLRSWKRDRDGNYRSGRHCIRREGSRWVRAGVRYRTLGAAKLGVHVEL